MNRKSFLRALFGAILTGLTAHTASAKAGRTVIITNATTFDLDVYVAKKKVATLPFVPGRNTLASHTILQNWVETDAVTYVAIARRKDNSIAGVYSGHHPGINMGMQTDITDPARVTDKDLIT